MDPSSFDFPLDDQNDSPTPSLKVYVGVTTFSEKETGTERQGDGEEDYFEDAQLLSKYSNDIIYCVLPQARMEGSIEKHSQILKHSIY